MRILGIGSYNDFGSLYLKLAREGHEVRVFIAEPAAHDILQGMITRVEDWRAELPWVRDGLILFEDAGRGALQDQLRADGYRVVGGSALGDRLEQDREYGQQVLRDAGMTTAAAHPFTDFDTAIAFVRAKPGRYVLKFDGSDLPPNMNYVGSREDGGDIVAMLSRHRRTWEDDYDDPPRFILMDYVSGVETGLGAFFDGRAFVGPVNLDWEHKRLFPGDVGELTGEMGTVVTYRDGEKLFDATLAGLAPLLRTAGHVGYVNLNTIINERGVWPLELTMRFGYPGFAILSALFAGPCGDMLMRIAIGDPTPAATYDGFAVGVVLTMPPFPHDHGYEDLSKGTPILVPELTDEEREHVHFGEVGLVDGELVATGIVGYTMVVTGRGPSIEAAQQAAYDLARRIAIPNVRYRNDIGDALRTTGWARLAALGWVPSSRR
jgi:phosphoribosylamine--glycine ligase